ncbi:MAG: MarR family transcriptional regulator [Actinobacteria bacterium]|nr:MarR family transcriptional regulator [Actinomycetota bacterium]
MTKVEIAEPYLGAWRAFLNAHATTIAEIDDALAAAGLPPLAWYDVLWPLHDAPGRRLRMGELAARVVTISRSGLTRLVDRVESAGLLRREACATDRRGTEIVLTDAGKAMLRRMWPVYAGVIESRFAAHLSEADAELLADVLSRVVLAPAE